MDFYLDFQFISPSLRYLTAFFSNFLCKLQDIFIFYAFETIDQLVDYLAILNIEKILKLLHKVKEPWYLSHFDFDFPDFKIVCNYYLIFIDNSINFANSTTIFFNLCCVSNFAENFEFCFSSLNERFSELIVKRYAKWTF